jgi:predicted nucleic acid-binding protein
VILEPTPDHATVLRRLLQGVAVGGNLVNDAHLAALSVEHRCSVVSYDNDFSRFEGVVWERPVAG